MTKLINVKFLCILRKRTYNSGKSLTFHFHEEVNIGLNNLIKLSRATSHQLSQSALEFYKILI